ncbi:UPF0606 protein KIAA1549L, partial [Dissostichus eleginoides]
LDDVAVSKKPAQNSSQMEIRMFYFSSGLLDDYYIENLPPIADGGHHEKVRRAVRPLDPAVPIPWSGVRAGAKDKAVMDEGKVFSEAGAAVWTETEAGVRVGTDGNVFAGARIMTGTLTEVGAEWSPTDAKGGGLPMMPRNPADFVGPQSLQTPSKTESETARSESVSLVVVNSNSPSSNSSSTSEESVSSRPAWDLPTVPESLLSTVGDHDITLPSNITSPFSTHQWNTTIPAHTRNTSRLTTTSTSIITTSLPPTTTTSTLPSSTTAQTPRAPTETTSQDTVTNESLQLTTVTTTTPSTTTITVTTAETTPPPTTTTEPPSSTTPEESPLPCNVTEKYWVRTVLSIELRRNRLDLILKQNLSKGLSHALQRALNDSTAYAQVEHDDCSPHNVTLGYYVTSGKTVYISSLVVEAMHIYGFDKLLSDIRQHTPLVKAVLVPVATWMPAPSIHLQLKTGVLKKSGGDGERMEVLRFVGPTDNIYSCSFVQMLEQRLENAYDEAQDKVLETYSRLTVEIQSVYQEAGSPSISVVYVVKNQDAILNGTISSGLLNQLTAELVGYFLFYPPMVIAEHDLSPGLGYILETESLQSVINLNQKSFIPS